MRNEYNFIFMPFLFRYKTALFLVKNISMLCPNHLEETNIKLCRPPRTYTIILLQEDINDVNFTQENSSEILIVRGK